MHCPIDVVRSIFEIHDISADMPIYLVMDTRLAY